MRPFVALLAVALVGSTAEAGWSKVGAVSGVAQDIVVVDGGLVVASSSSAGGNAVALLADAGVFAQLVGNFVGAGVGPNGCLIGLQSNRSFVTSSGCAVPASLIGGSTPVRFRITPMGAGIASATSTFDSIYSATSGAGPYTQQAGTWLGASSRSIGVVDVAGAELTVFNQASNSLVYSVDGGAATQVNAGFNAVDAVPFAFNGQPAVLAAVNDGGLVLVSDVRTAAAGAIVAVLPAGAVARTVAMTNNTDSPRGYGLVTTSGGEVLSPIPDPAHVGVRWVVRPGAPVLSGRVHCLDASWCAGFGPGGAVHLLENSVAPTFEVDAGSLTPGVSARVEVDAGDADGDPVFVTWSSPTLTITPISPDGRIVDLLSAATACSSIETVQVTVWDGKAGHETKKLLAVPVQSSAGGFLQVSPSALTVAAGSTPISFVAGLDGGCDSLGPVLWSPGGSTSNPFVWSPPRNVCAPAGDVVPISVSRTGATATAFVTVTPWGPAETPTFASPALQDAGTTVLYTPLGVGHVCETIQGFPGARLEWAVDAGGHLKVTVVDGGLQVEAPACESATVHAEATRSVVSMSNSTTGIGVLEVNVVANLDPINASTAFSMGLSYDAGASVAAGTFFVGANCLEARSLTSTVEILRLDGGVVANGTFSPVPGGWSLPVPGGCNGGDYLARARLFSDGGATGAIDQAPIHAEQLLVGAGELSPTSIEAICGVGAGARLSLAAPAGTCSAATVSWSVVGGPAVIFSNGGGREVDVQTADTSFSLLGRSIDLAVFIDAGHGNSLAVERSITITGPRFVTIEPSVSPLNATSEDLLVASLAVTNTSDCAVDALSLTAQLSGLVPDLSTVRTARGALTAQPVDGELKFDELSLSAHESLTVRFEARPRVLGSPRVTGAAFVRGLPVDRANSERLNSNGCGCTSLPGLAPMLWLLAFHAHRRRRQELS